jgi:hypothetical protein
MMVVLILPLAVKPLTIFASNWAANNSEQWQRIVIVRYRSRKDIADIFANEEFALAARDKWAGLQDNQRMLVQAVHIPELFALGILLLIALAIL